MRTVIESNPASPITICRADPAASMLALIGDRGTLSTVMRHRRLTRNCLGGPVAGGRAADMGGDIVMQSTYRR